jgi:hypothetical protein
MVSEGSKIMTDLNRHRGYTPVSRARSGVRSPIKDIMTVRSAALVDRARIAAEVANQEFLIHERMDATYDLAEHMARRSARLRAIISETGNDPELHQFHTFIKGAATGAIVNLMQGDEPR